VILYFLRHAEAESGLPGPGDDRRLTAVGEATLRAAGPLLRRLNLRPDAVISSPLPRALRSAELMCEVLGGTPIADDRLRPGARWSEFAQAMAGIPGARRILFVGHEPDLSGTVGLLTGATSVRMRKAGIACVDFPGTPEPGAGELAWLIDPDLYTDPGG
jgi:phosphohistidine phosphatase